MNINNLHADRLAIRSQGVENPTIAFWPSLVLAPFNFHCPYNDLRSAFLANHMNTKKDIFYSLPIIKHILSCLLNLCFGVMIGVLVYELINLFASNWVAGVFAVVFSAGMLVAVFSAERCVDWVFERMFSSGIRPAKKTVDKNVKPLTRRLAFTCGFILGLLSTELELIVLDQISKFLEIIT